MSKKKNKILTSLNEVQSLLNNPTPELSSLSMHSIILLDVPAENFVSESIYLSRKIMLNDPKLKCDIVPALDWNERSLNKIRESLQFKNENQFLILPKVLFAREEEIQKFVAVAGANYFYVTSTTPVENITVSDLADWNKCFFDVVPEQKILVFGDVHESVYAWKELSRKVPENTLQISLGDLFDKGFDTIRTLEMAEEFVANGNKIIIGNHESYVARRLLGDIVATNVEADYFTSLAVFQNDSNLAERFLKIYKETLPFVRIKNDDKTFYLSHAPCYTCHLGKLNKVSQQLQRNFYFSSREPEQMKQELAFLNPMGDYDNTEPIHIFGHINHTHPKVFKGNKIWLDTSAVYGGRLTSLLMEHQKPMQEISIVSECRIPKKEHLRMSI